ncbi:FH1/FH2 domain-containing protein 1 isoform X1 [Colossoma macropomum]|uniref:FH1/FH2 domain-containing protein 1 isoform X1 n=1 Tax=Colossoma macropomum TaxID=42526 RepID=UPI0018641A2C|nr:FH1/FH2 domain-containing protein 1 isoform X1 [Colossoma macropomum]
MKETECSLLEQPWTSSIKRAHCLRINALDFSDLWDEEDLDQDLADDDSSHSESSPVQNPGHSLIPPTPPPAPPLAPPLLSGTSPVPLESGRRTLRLHWRELLSLQPLPRVSRFGPQSIWAGLEPVRLDTNRLEYLFKTKSNSSKVLSSLTSGKQKQPCVSVLGVKRSNIITIALSSLPPPHLLPPAIYSMDSSVLDREDVQRLQSLVPSEEELNLIKQAKAQASPCLLAPAEHCLHILGNIKHLSSRLQLWAFALDYDALEREIAEPLFHLKLAMEQLAANQTFRCILATVLAIGNFLNGCKARGFELSYLGKLSQVRDTHSRQPLLHHVCVLLLQLYPQSSDLYSDITAVTRASKCDYSQVQSNLDQLESHCKASWEQLRLLEKDGEKKKGGGGGGGGEERGTGNEGSLRQRLPHFLKECGERLKVLRAVHRRVINRFHSFLLYLGYSRSMVRETSADAFCKTVSDFALEYRAARHGILQQREREQEREKEREKDEERGRDPSTPKSKAKALQSSSQQDHEEQSKLEEVLKTPTSSSRFDFSLPRRRSKTPNTRGSLPPRLKW